MRIAFISPKWHALVNSYPPLGIGYLAAVAEGLGHTVAVFDLGLEPDTPLEQDVARIVAYAPDLIAMTAMTHNYHSAERTMSLLKERLDCPIVLGGPHATLFPERLVATPMVDYVVYGEGEETLAELLRVLKAEGRHPAETILRGIQGLCFTGEGGVICNLPRPLIADLDALPWPARHLYELARYPLYAANGEPMVTVLSSRGCPYNCSYCFKAIVGRTYRQRSSADVIEEIEHLKNTYSFQNYYFIDDLFTFDRERLREITTMMIERKLDIRWQCLARVDRVTEELLALMKAAGCREVHYGIESGNPEILKSLGKAITMEQVRQAVRWTSDVGIMVKGYFMLGLPGDTEATMQQTIDFASELTLDEAMFSLTTPFPGTRLWDELVARDPGIEFDQDFTRAFYYNNYDEQIAPFFNLSQVSDERLAQLAFEAQARFQEAIRHRKYVRRLGPGFGELLYRVSRSPVLRRFGHDLLRHSVLGKFAGLKGLGEYNAREEYASKWN